LADKSRDVPPAENPPADNNKRLAYLEETAPKVLAIAASLLGKLLPDHELAPRDAGEDPLVHTIRLLTEAQDALEERAGNSDDAETIAALEEKVLTLEEDLATVRKAEAAANRGARMAHRQGKSPGKARKVGELKDGTDREALLKAMDDGENLEIVLSTGTAEILEFDPIMVYPQAFRRTGRSRFDLIDAVIVKGAGKEQRVRGVALLAGGKQIAYTAFPNPVKVPVGQQVKFDRMIGFVAPPSPG